MIPISSSLVSGYSKDFFGGKEVIFDYSKGASLGETTSTPELLSATPMSLWNVALELHVGRCYSPFLGPLSDLFVFISGLLITLVCFPATSFCIGERRRAPNFLGNLSNQIYFAHCSASVSLLPISQEAKPH